SLFHGTDESLVRVTTLEICTALHRQRRSFFRGFSKLVAPVDIIDRTAVGNYVALKAPFTAQDVVQQMCVRAIRFSVRSVIRTHYRRSVRLRDGGLKGGQICFTQLAFCSGGVEAMALGFWTRMDSIMLGCRDDLEVPRIVALKAFDERNSQTPCQ